MVKLREDFFFQRHRTDGSAQCSRPWQMIIPTLASTSLFAKLRHILCCRLPCMVQLVCIHNRRSNFLHLHSVRTQLGSIRLYHSHPRSTLLLCYTNLRFFLKSRGLLKTADRRTRAFLEVTLVRRTSQGSSTGVQHPFMSDAPMPKDSHAPGLHVAAVVHTLLSSAKSPSQ